MTSDSKCSEWKFILSHFSYGIEVFTVNDCIVIFIHSKYSFLCLFSTHWIYSILSSHWWKFTFQLKIIFKWEFPIEFEKNVSDLLKSFYSTFMVGIIFTQRSDFDDERREREKMKTWWRISEFGTMFDWPRKLQKLIEIVFPRSCCTSRVSRSKLSHETFNWFIRLFLADRDSTTQLTNSHQIDTFNSNQFESSHIISNHSKIFLFSYISFVEWWINASRNNC